MEKKEIKEGKNVAFVHCVKGECVAPHTVPQDMQNAVTALYNLSLEECAGSKSICDTNYRLENTHLGKCPLTGYFKIN